MENNNQNSEKDNEMEYVDIEEQIEDMPPEKGQSQNVESAQEKTEMKSEEAVQNKEPTDNQKELNEMEKKYNDAYAKYLRALADYENLQKRTSAERSNFLKTATEQLILKLLDLADNFERADDEFSKKDPSNIDSMIEGFKAIHKQFKSILNNEGAKKIESIGKKFDPNFHEAVFVRTNPEVEEDTVLEEVQPGYLLNSKVIRPTKVVISKKE